jgi:hypothetical protein
MTRRRWPGLGWSLRLADAFVARQQRFCTASSVPGTFAGTAMQMLLVPFVGITEHAS